MELIAAIDFDDEIDDRCRIVGEWLCCEHTQHRWYSRVLTRGGIVEFHREDQNRATIFSLKN